ncbi:hypothetical protein P7K49_014407 [Saguinus oedipus]|uniref:Uncharacterized protein n=1 Tax=Saguinus oedipus TaxID=9490 RepID=A0ABQ9VJ28_SAGOE|nr:hypothetical protein P7K49_014407 [Saguinus oedipus]
MRKVRVSVCKITRCPMIPCYISSPDKCLWMDWVMEKNINGHQAKFFPCIKRSNGSCAWYHGAVPAPRSRNFSTSRTHNRACHSPVANYKASKGFNWSSSDIPSWKQHE